MPTISGTPTQQYLSNATTNTFSFNMPATGARRAVVVNVGAYDASSATISGVTYGGVSMTQVGSTQGTMSGNGVVEQYILIDPPTGANDVVITGSEELSELYGSASGWVDVDQTTPTTGTASGSGSSTTPSVSPTVSGSNVGIGFVLFFSGSTTAATESDTLLSETDAGPTTSGFSSQYGDSSLSWTLDNSSSWEAIGFAAVHDAGSAALTASGTPSASEVTASGTAGILSSVVITDVNTTESWTDGDSGLVITGTGFV